MPISFRPIVIDEDKVRLGEVNSTKKEEAVVGEILKKVFQGASVVYQRSCDDSGEDVFAKTVPKIISQVLAALRATKQDTITAPEMAKDRGVDFYQRGVAQTCFYNAPTQAQLSAISLNYTRPVAAAGQSAGQTIFHVRVHPIPRRDGDVANPRGGVRGVIPNKQSY